MPCLQDETGERQLQKSLSEKRNQDRTTAAFASEIWPQHMSTLAANVVNVLLTPKPARLKNFDFTKLQYVSIATVGVMRAPCTRKSVHSECYPIFVSP